MYSKGMQNKETYVEISAEFLSAALFDRVLSSLNHLLAADMLQITPVSADSTWMHHKKRSKNFVQKCKSYYCIEKYKITDSIF